MGLDKRDIDFTKRVLKDAEELDWPSGYLPRSRRAIKRILLSRVSDAQVGNGSNHGGRYGGVDDPLFIKKGWNKIDSGFRVWNVGGESDGENKKK